MTLLKDAVVPHLEVVVSLDFDMLARCVRVVLFFSLSFTSYKKKKKNNRKQLIKLKCRSFRSTAALDILPWSRYLRNKYI